MPPPNNRRAAALFLVLLGGPAAVPADAQLFPGRTPFEYPIGSARTSGVVGRLIDVSRGESRYGDEREADVSIGGHLPVVGLGPNAFLGLTIRVTGRFSLDDPRSALISNDWTAGLHAAGDLGPWRIAGELLHESSHLGDEYAARFGASRVDWTREIAALWIRRRLGPFAAHLMGSYTLIDELPLDRAAAGLGLDYRGDCGTWLGARIAPAVGVFAEAQDYAGWKVTTSARAGVDLDRGGRRVGVGLVYLNGLSSQRQFYDRLSRYWGVELRFDW